ncbi:hypothetical protein KVY03_04160 [Epilithonimonas sp. FP105]|nr:hypothetical protein [Epilithonimonas sp. FP105]
MDIRIIIRIHNLVNIQQTGSPKGLAENLKMSERMVYHYLNYMKSEMNAPIKYNFKKQSYCYTDDAGFCFIIKKINNNK